jgi:5-methylcytosine-specific restriction endonuclease McrA
MLHYMERWTAERRQEPCSIDGCLRSHLRGGLCDAHYWRRQKYGDPLAGGPFRAVRGTGNRWQYDENRRAAKAKMSQVTGETAEYVAILRRDPCVYCGAPCEHIDHIVPFADEGPTEWTNLAPACAACNHKKSRKSLLIFLLEGGADEPREAA